MVCQKVCIKAVNKLSPYLPFLMHCEVGVAIEVEGVKPGGGEQRCDRKNQTRGGTLTVLISIILIRNNFQGTRHICK